MKDQLIISIITESMNFLTTEQARQLRDSLDKHLYEVDILPRCTALSVTSNMPQMVMMFITAKKLDGLSAKTLEHYARRLSHFASHFKKNVAEITTMDIRMYLLEYSKIGRKGSTVNSILSIIKSFFEWLTDEKCITSNPAHKIKNVKTERRTRKALTPEELEMLRDSCGDLRDKALVEFFYSTGCRIDEAYKLNKDDIQWHNCSVTVIGKGDSQRTTYINARCKVHLWKYLNSRVGVDESEALFVSEKHPHNRLGMRAIQKIFNRLGKAAGITKSVYPHLMRHTTATSMLRNGAAITDIQQLLGHEDINTTMIYAETDQKNVQMSHSRHVI